MTKDGLIEQYSEPVTFNDGSGGDAINIFHLKDILRLNEQHIYENHEVLQKWKEDIRKECQPQWVSVDIPDKQICSVIPPIFTEVYKNVGDKWFMYKLPPLPQPPESMEVSKLSKPKYKPTETLKELVRRNITNESTIVTQGSGGWVSILIDETAEIFIHKDALKALYEGKE